MRKRTANAAIFAIACGVSVPTAVYAQSGSQVYGLIDLGVEHVNNLGPTQNTSITRMQFGSAPSRLGFRGSEDLGGGLKANYVLEMGINANTGSIANGGRGFGRASTLGLSGPWGAVTVGRQLTMLFWSLVDTDVMIPGMYSSASLDPYLANSRADNSIAYRGTFNGLTVGATFSLGRDVVNTNSPGGTNCPGESTSDRKACREMSAMVKYDTPTWGAAIATDRINGGPGAFGGLVRGELTDRRDIVNGYVKFGAAKLTAGFMRRDNEGSTTLRRSDMSYVGASYSYGPWLGEAELLKLNFKNSPNGATLGVLRGTYFLSKRTALYATIGHIRNRGTQASSVSGVPGVTVSAGGVQSGVMSGIRHSF